MEQSFADLLSDAFADAPVPSFLDGDLDFENLNIDEKLEEKAGVSHENLATKEDEALQQEAAVLSETKDTYLAENADEDQSDEEDFQGEGVKAPEDDEQEDYTSSDGESDQEGSATGDDEEEDMGTEEEPRGLLMSVRCDNEFCDRDKEDGIFAEGQPLAPEGAENPQVRNEEQGESESDEEVSYFERVPERGSEMMTKGDRIEEENEQEREEEEEEQEDSDSEGMKIEQEDHVLTPCFEPDVENPCSDGPTKASLEFPEISVQNLQDLIAEVDSEEYVEMKMKDFSGEEHQEAGESFADYPSDFSSCEYVERRRENQESKQKLISKQSLERAKDGDEEGDKYLYSIDLEKDAHKFRSLNEKDGGKIEMVKHMLGCDDGGETSESDSYSSSDDEVHLRRSDEENISLQDLENNKQLEETHSESISDDYNRPDPADFNINWNLDVLTTDKFLSEDLLTTEDADKAETPPSDVTPAEDINSYTVVQRGEAKTTSPSNQGSVDDSFFFNTELEVTELGQLGDDEYEEERNWEQERERIKAFYEFYDDSDGESGREGRQTKVQFCTDPLSQVIHYETDSSDRDSLSSSTDGEEDLSSAETSEELKEPDNTTQMKPACEPRRYSACDPPNTQLPEKLPDLTNTQTCSRKHKCLDMLKLAVKMGVVIVMGLLMFWVATDQAGWLSQMSFF
ncbi:uncharacterized protein ABDE67_007658 [Symphorus nematophorus]